ncbi:MAG: RDD family protein [Planctomycetes bacterium]|nr:RDD family protein [Planctomycetota bacterium]
MKLQPGTIIIIFMVFMFSMLVYMNSKTRNMIQRESSFDSVRCGKIYVAHSTLQKDFESKYTVLEKNDDEMRIFASSDGTLVSIDSNAKNLLVHTTSAIYVYDNAKDAASPKSKPQEIPLTNLQSILPFELRSKFTLPQVELVRFDEANPDELLIIISQINVSNATLCFIKRKTDGTYTLSGLPTLTLNIKMDRILKTEIVSIKTGEYMLFSTFSSTKGVNFITNFTDGKSWQKIDSENFKNISYFDVDKSNRSRIDVLLKYQSKYALCSFAPTKEILKNVKNPDDFDAKYTTKYRQANLQSELKAAYSITSDDKNQYIFSYEKGRIQQARLINWETGSFSQAKALFIKSDKKILPDLNKFWFLILGVLAGAVFIVIFAILRKKRGFKRVFDPVGFLEDTKVQKATAKEEVKHKLNGNDNRLKLLGRTDIERPKKSEIPDLGDPFSIYEHFGYLPAGLLIRTLAAGIDLVLLSPLFYWVGSMLDIRIDDLYTGPDWIVAHLLILFVHFVYFTAFEYYLGKTPGKMFAGVRTVTIDNKPMRFWQVAVRNLIRIPDYYLFIVMVFNMRAQRLGDLICKTVVIFDTKNQQ